MNQSSLILVAPALSVVAAFFSLLTARSSHRLNRTNIRESIKPIIIPIAMSIKTGKEGHQYAGFDEIKNIGRGSAMSVQVTVEDYFRGSRKLNYVLCGEPITGLGVNESIKYRFEFHSPCKPRPAWSGRESNTEIRYWDGMGRMYVSRYLVIVTDTAEDNHHYGQKMGDMLAVKHVWSKLVHDIDRTFFGVVLSKWGELRHRYRSRKEQIPSLDDEV